MTVPTPRNALQVGQDSAERMAILESRTGVPPRLTSIGRGSVMERDVYFGDIDTIEQQVYLANLRPNWFNTEWGWEESFYLNAGTDGLEVPGLVASANPGWYPTGRGPAATMYGAGAQALAAAGSWFSNYRALDVVSGSVPPSSKNCIDEFISYDVIPSPLLRMKMAGYYRLRGLLVGGLQAAGSASMSLRVNTFDSSTLRYAQTYTITSEATLNHFSEMNDVLISAADIVVHQLNSGTPVTVGGGTSFLSAEYLRPPLVSRTLT